MTDTVGLVGFGFIGASIGERLLVTGEPPVVLDVVPERVEALVAQGAVAAGVGPPTSPPAATSCSCACRPTSSASTWSPGPTACSRPPAPAR